MVRFLAKASVGLVLCVLIGSAVAVQAVRDEAYPAQPLHERLLYVTSGDFAKKLALSHDALMADVYWIRALQNVGGNLRAEGEQQFDELYPLLDVTTSLDPAFMLAYRFGAIFLAEPLPLGAGQPDLAIKLLEKGVAQAPERWEYYLDIGFIYYWRLGDYTRAADWFQRGADLPDGPWWLRSYAAVMLTKGGDREASRFLWQNFYDTAENDWMRENAERRLLQLDALDRIDGLRQAVATYLTVEGHLPGDWTDLIGAGLLRGVPIDPTESEYVLDPRTGAVDVAESSLLYPLPVEPESIAADPSSPVDPALAAPAEPRPAEPPGAQAPVVG